MEFISDEALKAYNILAEGYQNNLDQLQGVLLMEILLKLQKLTEKNIDKL